MVVKAFVSYECLNQVNEEQYKNKIEEHVKIVGQVLQPHKKFKSPTVMEELRKHSPEMNCSTVAVGIWRNAGSDGLPTRS